MNSCAPLIPRKLKDSFECQSFKGSITITELAQQMFDVRNFLVSTDPRHGRYLSASAIFRGTMKLEDVDDEILKKLKCINSSYFVDWIPENLKTCVCSTTSSQNSGSVIANSTSIQWLFRRVEERFSMMFRRKAFLQWFTGEGMDEMEFSEAQANLKDLISEYQQYEESTVVETPLMDYFVNLTSQSDYFSYSIPFSTFFTNESVGVVEIFVQHPSWLEESFEAEKISTTDTFSAISIAIKDDYVYVADHNGGFRIISIADKFHPTSVSSISYGTSYGVAVHPERSVAYLCDGTGGLRIYDVEEKHNPYLVKRVVSNSCSRVKVSGDFAFVADGKDGVLVVNITESTESEIIGKVEVGLEGMTGVHDLFVVGDFVYAADRLGGLKIIDVSEKTNPLIVGRISTYFAESVFVENEKAYVADANEGLKIIDVSNVYSPTLLGSLKFSAALELFIKDNLAYVACARSGLRILNVSNSSNPSFEGHLSTSYVSDVEIVDRFIYVADNQGGLLIATVEGKQLEGTVPTEFVCGNQTIVVVGSDSTGSVSTSFNIFSSNNLCKFGGECDFTWNNCSCSNDYYGRTCESFDCFGYESTREIVCNTHGDCVSPNKCVCEDSYFGKDCVSWPCFNVPMNDKSVCGTHGYCIGYDNCQCWEGYEKRITNRDCSVWKCFGIDMDNSYVCKERGECTSPDECICEPGYFGVECESLVAVTVILSVVGGGFVFCVICVIVGSLIFALAFLFSVFCCCSCVVFAFLLRIIGKQRSGIQRYRLLKNFDVLLTEQLLDDGTPMANIEIKKEMFSIAMAEITNLEYIGEGGSKSVVFKARWNSEIVALKCFKLRHICLKESDFKDFEKEVEVHASLRHPNIVRFFGCCFEPPRIGIVMEYCDNGEILDFFDRYNEKNKRRYPKDRKLRMVAEICSVMQYLHGQRVIHRDLKAENILVDYLEKCKLMDFGLSRIYSRKSESKTKRIGTSAYIAPELMNEGSYAEKCDVYSFGILVYVIFTEKSSPYKDSQVFNVQFRVAANPNFRPDLGALKGVEKWVVDVITSCWSHDQDDRPSFNVLRSIFETKLGDDIIWSKD